MRTYENIDKIGTGQGDDCINVSLLDYPYFKDSYNIKSLKTQLLKIGQPGGFLWQTFRAITKGWIAFN